MKERTIEVTIGNSEKSKKLMNPNDVGDVKEQGMKEIFLELFRLTDEIAVERNFKFVDQYVNEDQK